MTQRQTWNPELYARNARFVADLGMPVVELLAPQAGESILDLGCGDGVLTEKLQALGCQVLGVDSSAEQVAAAQAKGLQVQHIDAEQLAFAACFDAVFSNAALHWMKQADAVIQGVWQALKPGGRFVAECGGEGNVYSIRQALYATLQDYGIDPQPLDPWYFPSIGDYQARLQQQGFEVVTIDLIPRPTPLPGAMTAWLETFAESFTQALPFSQRGAFIAHVQERLRPQLCNAAGDWTADYVRLRFRAIKPQT